MVAGLKADIFKITDNVDLIGLTLLLVTVAIEATLISAAVAARPDRHDRARGTCRSGR